MSQGSAMTIRLTARQRNVLDDLASGHVLYWPTVNTKGLRGIWIGPPREDAMGPRRIKLGRMVHGGWVDLDVHARTAQALRHLKLIRLLARGHRVNRYTITNTGRAALK